MELSKEEEQEILRLRAKKEEEKKRKEIEETYNNTIKIWLKMDTDLKIQKLLVIENLIKENKISNEYIRLMDNLFNCIDPLPDNVIKIIDSKMPNLANRLKLDNDKKRREKNLIKYQDDLRHENYDREQTMIAELKKGYY